MTTHHEDMHDHFSEIAPFYRDLRATDPEPIQLISGKLKHLDKLRAADIGCGAGRYSLLLFQKLNNVHLTCVDCNEAMLRQATAYLKGNGINNSIAVNADASDLPFEDNSVDCVFTFNAVHHFNLAGFLEEAARITTEEGFIFIYTRLQSQNARNIWGRYFPLFLEKEKRLYELNDLTEAVHSKNMLITESIRSFRFKRNATLNEILDKARKKHYSTFALYNDHEFGDSLNEFEERLLLNFSDPECVEYYDENIMFVLKVRPLTPPCS